MRNDGFEKGVCEEDQMKSASRNKKKTMSQDGKSRCCREADVWS
jgi:hypothetical protein